MIEELIDSSHFVEEDQKELCKKYFRQIPFELNAQWFYSYHLSLFPYQGDIINKFDFYFTETEGGEIVIRQLEDQTCLLLSNTCDMDPKEGSRKKFVSVAPVFDYSEFAEAERPDSYSRAQWGEYLKAVKKNMITEILFIPGKNEINDSVVFLDRIFSCEVHQLLTMMEKERTRRLLTLSQIGHYYFLIKLTHHFARIENKKEIKR